MGEADSLRRYRGKRDFGATSEPRGSTGGLDAREEEGHGRQDSADGGPAYVVQIHDASTMHFDFRLEVDGVLKSWAVPKGPSTDPGDKRLAVPTEDHPLEYREYEGVIGGGQYGAGTVIVWDAGTYRPLNKDGTPGDEASFAKALAKGHASFWLDGPKLRGGFSLTRFRGGGDRGRENDSEEAWLLVKRSGTGADRSGRTTPDPRRARSARSGRTLRQVARAASQGEHGADQVRREHGHGQAAVGDRHEAGKGTTAS